MIHRASGQRWLLPSFVTTINPLLSNKRRRSSMDVASALSFAVWAGVEESMERGLGHSQNACPPGQNVHPRARATEPEAQSTNLPTKQSSPLAVLTGKKRDLDQVDDGRDPHAMP